MKALKSSSYTIDLEHHVNGGQPIRVHKSEKFHNVEKNYESRKFITRPHK